MVTLSITTCSVGVPGAASHVVDLLDDVEPGHDLAEMGVQRRQPHTVGTADHEELVAGCVGPAFAMASEPTW